MSNTLSEIAQQLKAANNRVQLIYAFNGTGKTRLSREFTLLIAATPDSEDLKNDENSTVRARDRILYYNALTEDLFFWDNDAGLDSEPKLRIQPNSFTDWILRDRGQDQNIIATFQRYTDEKLTPAFIEKEISEYRKSRRIVTKVYPEVVFSFERGSEKTGCVKISRGEESNFIWSIFYTLLEEVISILNEPDVSKRDDSQFDDLQYVFIDDPVSSLDDGHLIQVAVDLANLIKSSESQLRFLITTHSPLFYNVLHSEFENKLFKQMPDGSQKVIYKPKDFQSYRLEKTLDGGFRLEDQLSSSPFSYHLFLLKEIQKAIDDNQVCKFHFNFARNILEKLATFLGYTRWADLLPKTPNGLPDPFANRILNLSSHSAHSAEEIAEINEKDKEKLRELLVFLKDTHKFRILKDYRV